MIRFKALLCVSAFVLTTFALTSCSGPFKGCTTNCTQNGNANVSLTLIADTPPPNPSIFSFKVSITSITFTPTTGTAITFTPPSPIVIDLMRFQSDTAFLGSLPKVPAGNYTVKVSISGLSLVFFNDTSSNITNANPTPCSPNAVCTLSLSSSATTTVPSFTFTASANGRLGIELDFNLNNSITLSAGALTVNFNPSAPSPGVFTAFTLPRQNANLGTNQLELIEDFTGVVAVSGNNVTITSPTRGTLTAASTSGSFFDASPDSTLCQTPATFSCVANGQIASVDAFLNADGTFSLKEFEPLVATQKDLVEGIVYTVSGSIQQFGIVVTDKTQAATGSLISSVNTGDLLTVNLATAPPLQPFFVDQKGLPVSNIQGSFVNFAGQTSVSAVHQGQSISVHVTSFAAASGTTPASVVVDTVTLRWSRLIANVVNASSNSLINVNTVPSYFGFTPASVFATQLFTGTVDGDGVTTFDGIANGGIPGPSPPPVALRVLYLENTTNSAALPFMAARIRQH